MTRIVSLGEIREALTTLDVLADIERGFVEYSRGAVVVPPVGELIFTDPPGETHIKYGFIKEDEYYVVKIASGFYANARLGLPTSNGVVLLFSQKTGELLAVLLDEGHLTNVRTAAAGAVAAKILAPTHVERIGILGAGVQARMQLEFLHSVRPCRDALVWGRSDDGLTRYRADMQSSGFRIETTRDVSDVAATCNVIVTCTPSTEPLLSATEIRSGTHITAVGSDTPGKVELEPAILQRADRIVVDSVAQVVERGESAHAIAAGLVTQDQLIELGAAIEDEGLRRANDKEITVADLTGVAVQDIQIAKAVWKVIA